MVYKREVVQERLKHLTETLGHLKKLAKVSKNTFLEDHGLQWQAERGLQLAAEALFDIGDHILAGHFSSHPSDYEDVISKLRDNNVISSTLARRLSGLGGFRNIIVHDYMAINKGIVYDRLKNGLKDFEDFVKESLKWITQ